MKIFAILLLASLVYSKPQPYANCNNGVMYQNSCFFMLDRSDEFDVAVNSCQDSDSHLAYIESEEAYRTIESYLAKQMTAKGETDGVFWVGENYDGEQDKITFLDGRESTWEHKWFPGFPFKNADGWNYIAWQVHIDSSQPINGFLNHPLEANLYPVCQREASSEYTEKKMVQPKPKSNCNNGVMYQNSCFFMLDRSDEFDVAVNSCQDSDSHLAYIESEEAYRTIESYLAKQMTAKGETDGVFWVGENYDGEQDKITFLDGRESTWEHKWFPGFPFKNADGWNYIAWQVHIDSSQPINGFLNHPLEANLYPVCQREASSEYTEKKMVQPKPKSNCNNGVMYQNSCFFMLDRSDEFDVAVNSCQDSDSHLAYIESEEAYRTIESYLAKQMTAKGETDGVFWVGENYDGESDKITFLDGRESTWEHKWFPGFPFKNADGWNYIAWQVHIDSSQPINGFLNHPLEANLYPVCQRDA